VFLVPVDAGDRLLLEDLFLGVQHTHGVLAVGRPPLTIENRPATTH
jgi:hypothetical protein